MRMIRTGTRLGSLTLLVSSLCASTASADTRIFVHIGPPGPPVAPVVVGPPAPYGGYGPSPYAPAPYRPVPYGPGQYGPRAYAPAPYGYVQQPGYYVWSGFGYQWRPSVWARAPHKHARWVGGRWAHERRGWYWTPGYWR